MPYNIAAHKLGFTSEEVHKTPVEHSNYSSLHTSQIQEIEETTKQQNFNREEVEQAARESLDFLAAIAMPTIFKYFFPETYKQIWSWLIQYAHKIRDFSQLAIGFPRGFAKTTFIKLFILYLILFTRKRFILVCAHNPKKANAILTDVCKFLQEDNIKKVFGDYTIGLKKDTEDLKRFSFRGKDIVLAAGTVFSVRGINVDNERPDCIIFDDIQDKEEAKSQIQSESISDNLYSTAMKAKSPLGCLFIFVGNMYPTKWSILREIKKNPTWIKFIAGGILADGTSLWEDLQPIDQLLKEFQRDLAAGRPEVFYAEVLNDETASANYLIDISAIPEYPFDDDEIPKGKFVIIDPAQDKSNSDSVTVAYYELHNENTPCAKEIQEGRFSPGKTIEVALTICLQRNCNILFIESTGYQASLCYWFEFICLQRGITGIHCIEIYPGKQSKPTRIMDWFKSLMAKEFYLHKETRAATVHQIGTYNPISFKNVDGILDCHAYALRAASEYGPFICSQGIIEMQEWINNKVLPAYQNSPF